MTANAEVSLIGALMMEPSAIKDCGDLRPDMFTDSLLGRVFLEYLRASEFGYTANLVTIAENMSDVPKEELMGRLRECGDSTITSAAAGRYAASVIDAYKVRMARQIVNSVQFQPAEVDKQIGQLVNDLDALKGRGRIKARSLRQIVDDVSGRYFVDREKSRLKTGFPKLDECLGGLEGGDVIVIGARPAVGKSAFATQLVMNMGRAGRRVILYNLEMREAQIYERMASRLSGIRMERLRLGKNFLNDEKQRFENANGELRKLDIWISSGARTVSEIRNECRHMDADVIVIDYLQLILPDRQSSSRASEVGYISKAIKALAMELACPVVVLSQLNRVSEGRESKEPSMSELRESGDIEQDASVVILLWNADENDGSQKGLKIAKNRQGRQAKILLEFIGESMEFKELDEPVPGFKPARIKTPFDDE